MAIILFETDSWGLLVSFFHKEIRNFETICYKMASKVFKIQGVCNKKWQNETLKCKEMIRK